MVWNCSRDGDRAGFTVGYNAEETPAHRTIDEANVGKMMRTKYRTLICSPTSISPFGAFGALSHLLFFGMGSHRTRAAIMIPPRSSFLAPLSQDNDFY